MIGIKGVAKKPILDATAVSSDIISGKIAYNNTGRIVGSISDSSVLKEFTIHIKKGTYTTTRSSITYTRPKGPTWELIASHGTGDISTRSYIQETAYTSSGVTSSNALFLSEGLFSNDISSKYVLCGVQYVGSTTSGIPTSERLYFSNSSHINHESITTRNYQISLDRFVKTKFQQEISGIGMADDTGYIAVSLYIFNNYWTIAIYDGTRYNNFSPYQVEITDSFDIKLLLTNKIS